MNSIAVNRFGSSLDGMERKIGRASSPARRTGFRYELPGLGLPFPNHSPLGVGPCQRQIRSVNTLDAPSVFEYPHHRSRSAHDWRFALSSFASQDQHPSPSTSPSSSSRLRPRRFSQGIAGKPRLSAEQLIELARHSVAVCLARGASRWLLFSVSHFSHN